MNSKQLPIPVRRALRKLGRDIKEARLRRRIPVAVLAERASISRQTLSNIENGFPGVSIGNYASTLFSLGLIDRFSDVANPTGDVVGMSLEEENLPNECARRVEAHTESARQVSDTSAFVYVDLLGETHLVGRIWSHARHNLESATFQYEETWLKNPQRFSLEPALTLGRGAFHTEAQKTLFGAFGDSAPDRWGRVLMRRAERRRAQKEGRAPRTFREINYLIQVSDESRQGALRFSLEQDGPFVSTGDNPVPPLIELPRLLGASERIVDDGDDDDADEDLRLLLAPGSSLGGARPKVSVRDRDGSLAIAKFPHKNDELSAVLWEATALKLAEASGIEVPEHRIERIADKPVLILRRFDRIEAQRIPFLSAMSMLGARDHDLRSYMEIADALRQYGNATRKDLHQLWRRVVFNVLISNTDDHLQNHGFLYDGTSGWTLAPAYDLNPVPIDVAPRMLSTAIDLDDQTASLDLALDVAPYFELDSKQTTQIVSEVGAAIMSWRDFADHLGIRKGEIDRMASAFEHEDLRAALKSHH